MTFGTDSNPPTPLPSGSRACETDGIGMGSAFRGCGGTCSLGVGGRKVSWVSCRVCCGPGPLLPGNDEGEVTGRNWTGRVSWRETSDTRDSVSTVNGWRDC